jgi:hypothetical protein
MNSFVRWHDSKHYIRSIINPSSNRALPRKS